MLNKSKLDFMREAIRVAEQGVVAQHGGPFGALVVKEGEIVGKGHNMVVATNDPTAHAEITAIRDACHNLGTFNLAGCEIYINCEPCPMCLGAIYWARIDKIYFAATRSDAADVGFIDKDIYDDLKKGLDERTVKVEQLLREESLVVFKRWKADKERIEY